MFRSLSETFVRSCSVLLVLATVVMWRGKKSVVRVAQCTAAVVSVHRTPSLADVHCFLNPSGTSIRLPIQDCRFWPVDYIFVMACMISHRWFILFWQTFSCMYWLFIVCVCCPWLRIVHSWTSRRVLWTRRWRAELRSSRRWTWSVYMTTMNLHYSPCTSCKSHSHSSRPT